MTIEERLGALTMNPELTARGLEDMRVRFEEQAGKTAADIASDHYSILTLRNAAQSFLATVESHERQMLRREGRSARSASSCG